MTLIIQCAIIVWHLYPWDFTEYDYAYYYTSLWHQLNLKILRWIRFHINWPIFVYQQWMVPTTFTNFNYKSYFLLIICVLMYVSPGISKDLSLMRSNKQLEVFINDCFWYYRSFFSTYTCVRKVVHAHTQVPCTMKQWAIETATI